MRRQGASEEVVLESALRLQGAMNEVVVLWRNNLRFASEASLRAFLKQSGRLQGVKGDPLKKNASDLVEAAQKIMDQGVAIWTSKKKS